jgi:hypothetical protein
MNCNVLALAIKHAIALCDASLGMLVLLWSGEKSLACACMVQCAHRFVQEDS